MKKFLKQTAFATLVLAAICCAILGSTQLIYKNISYKLPEDKHIVILGDSHTECAIDDQILTSAVNLSRGGTGYLYSYFVLRKLVEQNSHIDTVILSYFDRSLAKSYDNELYSDERYSFKLPSFNSLMTYDDLKLTNQSAADIAISFVKSVRYLPAVIRSHGDFRKFEIGGYLKLDRHKLNQDMARYDTVSTTTQHIDFNTTQAKNLAKINTLCQQHNITLILMDTPVYQVAKFTNKALFDTQRDSLLKGYQYVDYSAFQLPEDCYADVTHLNYKGAEIFSQYLLDNGVVKK